MLALPIVKHLDVFDDVRTRRLSIRIDAPLDPFALQQLEKALGYGIVVSVSPPTHAGYQVVCLQEVLPVITRILTALVGMNDH